MSEGILQSRALTIRQAAGYLNATVWAVRELIWRGELPYLRVGKRFVIDRADLDAWVEARKIRAPLAPGLQKVG